MHLSDKTDEDVVIQNQVFWSLLIKYGKTLQTLMKKLIIINLAMCYAVSAQLRNTAHTSTQLLDLMSSSLVYGLRVRVVVWLWQSFVRLECGLYCAIAWQCL